MKQIVNITIKKHHALPFKILKRFADALLIILLLTVTFLAITPTPVYAQGIEEVVLYEENFNYNQAQDWELDHGWTVTVVVHCTPSPVIHRICSTACAPSTEARSHLICALI